MSNGYLTQIQPGDDSVTRRLCIQQWCEALAKAITVDRGGTSNSGGYLIDCVPQDVRQTVDCSTANWVREANLQA